MPVSSTDTKRLPLVVLASAPITGHCAPVMQIAQAMVERGFEVIFMSSQEYKEQIEKIGAEWWECLSFPGSLEELQRLPPGLEKTILELEKFFLDATPSRSDGMRALLEKVRDRDADRDVVIVNETCSMAILPFKYGAPLPKGYSEFPKVINVNLVPLTVTSIDTAPFGPALPPDSTSSGRARNKLLNEMMFAGPMRHLNDHLAKVLSECGCSSSPIGYFMDTWMSSYDCTLQLCSPSMEYPRSDLHPSIRYAGALPLRGLNPDFPLPSWWSEITANAALQGKDRKKVIVVSQGTVSIDLSELVVPTIRAFANREDVIVVSILGTKGATLPKDVETPANAHVIDYLPYDAILPYADLFINNGGYGGVIHSVNNGVPMIVAGVSQDKAEMSARCEYAGFAVNLCSQTPGSEAIYKGAEKIFKNKAYKLKAVRLQQENKDLDSLGIIEKQILAYAKK
ncbi:uncharacterized protein BCR38DRAFT_460783 [Pseudomassariella vexata]|uniref:UDP-glucuronosyl/UDP-glucosyltransferase n=1 Tax=Pseudomassariella vexata TaxID=1141098 RepID=A0A1Y2DGN6_9PEZI|nr:uncharacterized protein BCR38DRAFT_460783 [Pseudomassariella vexata]ORY58418.1 hypothetical protein BCR38DRAFT_460783 [Pseudomassariella vexata]